MPGCWEIRASRSVFAYTMHTDTCTIAWAIGLKQLQIPGVFVPLAGMPFDHCRNVAAQQMLQGGYEWLFSLDSDVICPPDTIYRLMAHKLPIVSGLYNRRSPPCSVPVMIKNGSWITSGFRLGALVEADFVGAGCLLIHRSVVEKFAQQPQRPGHFMFDWRVNYQGIHPPGECLSEDFTMCLAAKQRWGIRTMVDTGCKCLHIGQAQFGYGTIEPLNTYGIQCAA